MGLFSKKKKKEKRDEEEQDDYNSGIPRGHISQDAGYFSDCYCAGCRAYREYYK